MTRIACAAIAFALLLALLGGCAKEEANQTDARPTETRASETPTPTPEPTPDVTAQYVADLREVQNDMVLVAESAETMAWLVHDVWENTIEKTPDLSTNKYTIKPEKYDPTQIWYPKTAFNSDFNTSVNSLFQSEEYSELAELLEAARDSVTERFGKLQNPPSGLEAAFSLLREMYDEFYDLCGYALKPKGSLVTYTEKLNDTADNLVKVNDLLRATLPPDD